MAFWLTLLTVAIGLVAMWFFFVWLPDRLHMRRIGRRHGWPQEKQAAIKKLFLDGKLNAVGYIVGSNNPNEQFRLIIEGQFGLFVRFGVKGVLLTHPSSVKLPAEVAAAFEGYIDHSADVMWLLWYLPFLNDLQMESKGKVTVVGDLPRSLAIACT